MSNPTKGANLEGPATVHSPNDEDDRQMDREQSEQNPVEFDVKEQDRWLPIANVARIMKTALPENAKIAKEAKECMQECVSEFISFITSEASEKCQQEKRKTVNGEDILFAMTSLGFENYAEALKIYLTKYRETNQRNNAEGQRSGSGGQSNQQYSTDANAASSPASPPSAAAFNAGPSNTAQTLNAALESDQQNYGNVSYGQITGNGDGGY